MPENTATDPRRSSSHSEFIAQVADLCGEWNTTEEWIKRGEHFGNAIILPSINELRYAGRRLVDAFAAAQRGDAKGAERHLLVASEDLMKARHDVVDAVVYYVSQEANRIRKTVGAGYLQKYFTQYGDLFGLLKTMAQKTTQSRGDRTRRNEIYESVMRENFSVLHELYNALEASLPAIEQNIEAEDRKTEGDKRKYILNLGLRIASVIVAIVAVIITAILAFG